MSQLRNRPIWLIPAWLILGLSLLIANRIATARWQSFNPGLRHIHYESQNDEMKLYLAEVRSAHVAALSLMAASLLFGLISVGLSYRFGEPVLLLGLIVPLLSLCCSIEISDGAL